MREFYKSGVTPQQKLVAVNNKFGNNDIKNQQGTTRLIYDTLPTQTGAATYRFFEDSASRQFPFCNTGSDGNKLGVGDTMAIESISFEYLTYDPATGRFVQLAAFTTSFSAAQACIFSFEIANNRVIKNLSLTEADSSYNDSTNAVDNATLYLETQLVIPPLLNYVLELRTPNIFGGAPPANTYLRVVLNGTGGIIAPRTTF
jgi:hypothetical protein